MLKGETVTLYQKLQTGTDTFNNPVYEWRNSYVTVNNVLIGEPSPEEQINELNLYGRSIAYTLGIPKGDENDWENQIVEFFGHEFKTYGIPAVGIESNIPMLWHKKVKVERYE